MARPRSHRVPGNDQHGGSGPAAGHTKHVDGGGGSLHQPRAPSRAEWPREAGMGREVVAQAVVTGVEPYRWTHLVLDGDDIEAGGGQQFGYRIRGEEVPIPG